MSRADPGRAWWRPVWSLVGLLVAYYAFPAHGERAVLTALLLLLTVTGLVLLGLMMVRELANLRRGEATRSPPALATLLALVVIVFSFGFFVLDQLAPGQMAGLETRTDALYFTISTMTTVGFGDVHATGQLARVMVIVLIVFNVVVVAALARALVSRAPDGAAPQ